MNGTTIELGRVWLRLVQIAAVAMVLFHYIHLSFVGVFMDEAITGCGGSIRRCPTTTIRRSMPVLLGLSSSLFGWTRFALRLPVALSFTADIFALYLLSRQIGKAQWQTHFWVTLLLFVVSPIYWMVSAYALPDHLLLTGCLFALYFFFRFFEARAQGGGGSSRDLYLGALFLGLAALSKYNAAFLAVGIAAFRAGL